MRAYDLMFEHHKEIKCIMYKYDLNTSYISLLDLRRGKVS